METVKAVGGIVIFLVITVLLGQAIDQGITILSEKQQQNQLIEQLVKE